MHLDIDRLNCKSDGPVNSNFLNQLLLPISINLRGRVAFYFTIENTLGMMLISSTFKQLQIFLAMRKIANDRCNLRPVFGEALLLSVNK
jgi:hypothetical protein